MTRRWYGCIVVWRELQFNTGVGRGVIHDPGPLCGAVELDTLAHGRRIRAREHTFEGATRALLVLQALLLGLITGELGGLCSLAAVP